MQVSEKVKGLWKEFFLATVHRQENTDDEKNLREIFVALGELSKQRRVVLPIHLRTRKYLDKFAIDVADGIKIIDPVGYFDMLYLLENSFLVLTDSGGLQKKRIISISQRLLCASKPNGLNLSSKGLQN